MITNTTSLFKVTNLGHRNGLTGTAVKNNKIVFEHNHVEPSERRLQTEAVSQNINIAPVDY